jgi:hypothetical protein
MGTILGGTPSSALRTLSGRELVEGLGSSAVSDVSSLDWIVANSKLEVLTRLVASTYCPPSRFLELKEQTELGDTRTARGHLSWAVMDDLEV